MVFRGFWLVSMGFPGGFIVYILLWSLLGVVPGRSKMKLSITKQITQKVSLGSGVELFPLVPQFYSNCLCIVALVTRCYKIVVTHRYKIVVTRCYKIVVTRCAQRRANASSLSTSLGGRPTHRRLLQSAISKKTAKDWGETH